MIASPMSAPPPLRWAVRSRPLATETESGDLHLVAPTAGGALLAVIDGLGHGPEAAAASRLAAATLREHADGDPGELINRCHAALRGTRGAAMLVLALSFADAVFSWAGIGNVEGWHQRGTRREALVSKAGVVGYQISTPLQRQADLRPGDLFFLATDGISPRFADAVRSGGEPEEIAAAVLEKYGRANDDALVLVARCEGGPAS
ncbi:MAG TPA: SpoIIE family protein phosphatase [Polyangia bacterium]|nr:SpoIIE family protein phosphatase [Polyangia bacterium]